MKRPRFTIRALLILMLCVACFVGGWQVNESRHATQQLILPGPVLPSDVADFTPRMMEPQKLTMPPITSQQPKYGD
jgi:hypothetical protein